MPQKRASWSPRRPGTCARLALRSSARAILTSPVRFHTSPPKRALLRPRALTKEKWHGSSGCWKDGPLLGAVRGHGGPAVTPARQRGSRDVREGSAAAEQLSADRSRGARSLQDSPRGHPDHADGPAARGASNTGFKVGIQSYIKIHPFSFNDTATTE